MNFARRGEWGTVLNAALLYINAGIQGSRTFVRTAKTKPAQTAVKLATAVFFPVAVATAWNLSDPKRKAAYNSINDYEKEGNIIIVPPNPTQDASGRWNVIKIPLSQEVNNLSGLIRRPIEAAQGLEPLKFADFAKGIVGSVSPVNPTVGSALSSAIPQAIKPTAETVLNKSAFTQKDIVPQYMLNRKPEDQVYSNTSGTSRKLGALLGVSPIKVDFWIRETFGSTGSQVQNAVDYVVSKATRDPNYQVGGQNVLDAIEARFAKATALSPKELQTKPTGASSIGLKPLPKKLPPKLPTKTLKPLPPKKAL